MKAGRSFHNQRNLGGGRVFDSLGGGVLSFFSWYENWPKFECLIEHKS